MQKSKYKKKELQTLIDTAQNGDNKAIEEIIRRVQKNIYAMFFHLIEKKDDVSDLTQETLIKMSKGIYKLKNKKNFKSWLNQIATNVFYDYIRKNDNKTIIIDEKKFNEIKDKLGCEPGEKCLFSELDKLIKTALMTLPEDLRITIVLREYEGLSYDDISKITKTTLGTVKSRLSRAREKLQTMLKDFI